MPPTHDRAALRATIRARRRAVPAADRLRAAAGLTVHLYEVPGLAHARRIAGYWAVDGEVSLHALLSAPMLSGPDAADYCLPCIEPDRSLSFRAWKPGQPVEANRYGIPEPVDGERLLPEQIDVVLVPLLGFDRRGNRLGSGAGFYDRSFAFLRGQSRPAGTLLVGVAYSGQEVDALPAEDWDVPLDFVATEGELIRCHL